jgi:hypothetical protein
VRAALIRVPDTPVLMGSLLHAACTLVSHGWTPASCLCRAVFETPSLNLRALKARVAAAARARARAGRGGSSSAGQCCQTVMMVSLQVRDGGVTLGDDSNQANGSRFAL